MTIVIPAANATYVCTELQACLLLSMVQSETNGVSLLAKDMFHDNYEENTRYILEKCLLHCINGMPVHRKLKITNPYLEERVLSLPNMVNILGASGNDPCKVVINELMADDPVSPQEHEFIELRSLCSSRKSLQGYKLIGITGSHYQVGPIINLVINLWNFHTNDDGYFLAGGMEVHNADIQPDHTNFRVTGKYHTPPKLTDFLEDGNGFPMGVALLFNSDASELASLTLSNDKPYLTLSNNPQLLDIIRDNLVDLTVYARKAPTDRCNIFEQIYAGYLATERPQYVLRHFNEKSAKHYSLNRCTVETGTFLPGSFKLGYLTPKQDNDCSRAPFLFWAHLMEMRDLATVPDLDVSMPTEDFDLVDQCKPVSENPALLMSLNYQKVGNRMDEVMGASGDSCQDSNGLQEDSGTAVELDRMAKRRRIEHFDLQDGSDFKYRWEYTRLFREEWIVQIEQYQNDLISTNTLKNDKIKVWFEYLPNSEEPEKSTYRCRLCSNGYDYFKLDTRYKPSLASKEGVLKKSKKHNTAIINAHESTSGHQKVIEIMTKQVNEGSPNLFDKLQKFGDKNNQFLYEVTDRMFRTVYTETVMSLSFSSHPSLVLLQEQNGLDMGVHHYEKTSCARMALFISNTMHTELIEFLMREPERPISLIMDAATDNRHNHYFVLLIQTLENNRAMTYFYRLLPIGSDESSDGLFKLIVEAWEQEGESFLQFMKKNLIGTATDGASVMMGKKNGLSGKLAAFSEQTNVQSVHCMAHRLHLPVRRAFSDTSDIKALEKTLSRLYSYYNSPGHKRKGHLREMAASMNADLMEVSYIYEARWVASELRAVKNIQKSWEVIVKDLKSITLNNNFDAKSRAKAEELLLSLTDSKFLLLLHCLLDILNELNTFSLQFQKSHGLLISQAIVVQELETTIIIMGEDNSAFLKLFLSSIKCWNGTTVPDTTGCTELQLHSSENSTWKDIDLRQNTQEYSRLMDIRGSLFESLLDEVRSYFPMDALWAFSVLNPLDWPSTVEPDDFGKTAIMKLAQEFGYEEDDLSAHWAELLWKLIGSPDFCRMKKVNARDFWGHYLSQSELEISSKLRELIKKILVIPMGSADAERAFSVMNHIKNKRRSRLTPKNLEDILRLKLNGPKKLEEFPATKYSKLWFETSHMRTDDNTMNIKRTLSLPTNGDPNDEEVKTYLDGSSLF